MKQDWTKRSHREPWLDSDTNKYQVVVRLEYNPSSGPLLDSAEEKQLAHAQARKMFEEH